MTNEQLDQLSINTIRTLSMDAVQQANSGQHDGLAVVLDHAADRDFTAPVVRPLTLEGVVVRPLTLEGAGRGP